MPVNYFDKAVGLMSTYRQQLHRMLLIETSSLLHILIV